MITAQLSIPLRKTLKMKLAKDISMNNRKKFQQSGSGRSLLSALLCVVLSIALGSGISVAADNAVRSASEFDYPPFAIVLDDGSADGFSVELMRAALAAMGRKVVFTVGPWGEIKQKLEDGHLDALPKTE